MVQQDAQDNDRQVCEWQVGQLGCLPASFPLRLQDKPTQVYRAHSLQSNAGQGTTKEGWSGNRVNSNG